MATTGVNSVDPITIGIGLGLQIAQNLYAQYEKGVLTQQQISDAFKSMANGFDAAVAAWNAAGNTGNTGNSTTAP